MKIAFLYPGQGAQFKGMGADLYENNEQFKQVFDACSEACSIDLKDVCFNGTNLEKGEYVQPAIFAHSVALTSVVLQAGIKANCVGGLSLGEYAALSASSVFTPEEGCRLVRRRGKLMDEGVEEGVGGMAAVIGLDSDIIEKCVSEIENVWVANYISDGQTVIGGEKLAVESMIEPLKEAGAKMVQPLNVAGPFHTILLKEAAEAFEDVLKATNINAPQIASYSNTIGAPYEANHDMKELLVEQMYSPVKWNQCVKHMINNGVDAMIEIGPGAVLGKTIKREHKQLKNSVFSVQDMKSLEKLLTKF